MAPTHLEGGRELPTGPAEPLQASGLDGEKVLPGLERIVGYARAMSSPTDEVDASLVEATRLLGGPAMMMSTADQVQFLAMLVSLSRARDVLELGTFTGRAALAMARALPTDGRVITCDLSPRWTAIGREHWQRAGVADRVELRLEPVAELLRTLPARQRFDLVLLDADKGGYVGYYDEIVRLLRPGGILVADNVLAGGHVAGDAVPGSVADAMDRYNRRVAADDRVDVVVLPMADGLSLALKR